MSQTSGEIASVRDDDNTGEDGLYQDDSHWITCQLGFRDHYLVPRVLHRAGVLRCLCTEMWVEPGTLIHRLGGQRLRERYHAELASAPVRSWNLRSLVKELRYRMHRAPLWQRILDRNRWFQQRCISVLRNVRMPAGEPVTLFTYSYAARDVLAFARARGWRTVLGQMDAGQYDERLMIDLYSRRRAISGGWQHIPAEFWDSWREECQLADRIVVNSSWSREALMKEGIASAKIRVIPLAFEGQIPAAAPQRRYPRSFSPARPLRVLFLGMVNVRKGVAEAIEAIALLQGEPVQLTVVGPIGMNMDALPASRDPRVSLIGYLPRSIAMQHYASADVFLFPSHSDGFGLAQLEAQAYGLPIIASRFCGDVVRDEQDGLLLAEVTPEAIAAALRRCLRDPAMLERFAEQASRQRRFGVAQYGKELLSLF